MFEDDVESLCSETYSVVFPKFILIYTGDASKQPWGSISRGHQYAMIVQLNKRALIGEFITKSNYFWLIRDKFGRSFRES